MTKEKEATIDALLGNLWERNLPSLHERLDILDRAATAAASDKLTEVNREEAFEIAHKLSGTLGMFGYHQGTAIAQQIEQILNSPTPSESGDLITLAIDLRKILSDK